MHQATKPDERKKRKKRKNFKLWELLYVVRYAHRPSDCILYIVYCPPFLSPLDLGWPRGIDGIVGRRGGLLIVTLIFRRHWVCVQGNPE